MHSFKLDQKLGRPIKIDEHTYKQYKGRFPRICVEVPTSIPLPPAIIIDNFRQPIEYELNLAFYFSCGIIGHISASCAQRQQTLATSENPPVYPSSSNYDASSGGLGTRPVFE
ncbi:UNVERIFIED_CONTAM: hypothetical protein Slati_3932300 [Sesamum latifolium]|uniref:Zinc knuckle CX2CX4HX4C domain-containing protein n=1 Tax=Sesamum latifolium TaxID=2727402 RepID=A0AAW2TNX7_9LAMI